MKKESKGQRIFDILCRILLLFFLLGIVGKLWQYGGYRIQETQLRRIAEGEDDRKDNDDGVDAPMKRRIDFAALQSINPDIIGWLYIPGTAIDDPILCSSAQKPEDFYLTHTPYQRKDAHGSVYLQKRQARDLSDGFSVLYGHNMRDGTMFADLKKYRKEDFLKAHAFLYIYLPRRTIRYEVFAAERRDASPLLEAYGIPGSGAERLCFFRKVKEEAAVWQTPFAWDIGRCSDVRFLALSTCAGRGGRTVVFAAEEPL